MNAGDKSSAARRPHELTGRFVLFCFVGFFLIVIGVNFVLIRAATSTFGGVETENAYKAGLAFNNELAAARAQNQRHWKVTGHVSHNGRGDVAVEVSVVDENGRTPAKLAAVARLAHPTDARLDRAVAISATAGGLFRGTARAEAGQWDLVVDLLQGDERVFRSKSRIMLR